MIEFLLASNYYKYIKYNKPRREKMICNYTEYMNYWSEMYLII